MADNVMPPLDALHNVFAVVATVTPRGGDPVETTFVLFAQPEAPAVGDVGMTAPAAVNLRPTGSLPRTDLLTLPVGSTIETDLGDGLRVYRIDRVDDRVPDEWRVVMTLWQIPS